MILTASERDVPTAGESMVSRLCWVLDSAEMAFADDSQLTRILPMSFPWR